MINELTYDRVYLLGVDGAGNFFTKADTPNIDRIFADGAYNHFTLTAQPTISAQCWGSMLHGVTPQLHKFSNDPCSEIHVPEDFPYPSIFKATREAFPECSLASIVNWSPINYGIIEQGLNITEDTYPSDDDVCNRVCEVIRENDPKLLFVQFDSVDGAGHHYGYGEAGHLDAINHVDSLIGKICDTAEKCHGLEKTLIMVTADHGGGKNKHHGGNSDGEKFVSLYVRGYTVKKGEFGDADTRDIASVTMFAFGIKQPSIWSGRIPDNLFTNGISFERASEAAPDGSKMYSDRKSKPTPSSSEKSIENFADVNSMHCYFPFDGTQNDMTGKCKAKVTGKIYFTEGFYGQSATLDDCFISASPVNLGTENYTITMWLKFERSASKKKQLMFSSLKKDNTECRVFLRTVVQ